MDEDTDLGGKAVVFPATRCSLVRATASPDPIVRKQARETLISAYWKPVYKYIRFKGGLSNEDAKDLTQAFFAQAVEKDFFDRFDPAKGRFRTFLRVCVDGLVAHERRAATRLKRGGDKKLFSLDFDEADGELGRHPPPVGTDPDDFFRQEWLRSLFAHAVEDLRRQCLASDKDLAFSLFERYDLEGPDVGEQVTYAKLAEAFGLSVTQVTNYLALARRQFRQLLLNRLRSSTGDDDEYEQEVHRLFGGEVR
jgi:RNA polymerase sigma factor (sigma-70 family)